MYKERGKAEVSAVVDRKRINDALDKHLERSSPSTSRGGAKDLPSALLLGKQHQHPADHKDPLSRNNGSKNNASNGATMLN